MTFAADYVPVAERLVEFRAKYPEGSLRPADPSRPFEILTVGGNTFLVVVAAAYRTPDDIAPGIGMAWEPVPGLTNFTRNSELQNAESSAWGRAIIAVGAADAKRGIASAEDVQMRQAEAEQRAQEEAAVPGLRSSIEAAIEKLDDAERESLKAWFREQGLPPVRRMNAALCERVLDHLLEIETSSGSSEAGATAGEGAGSTSDGVNPAPTLLDEGETA
jgi:hypothetical protein